jgi:hypothetical protein
VGDLVGELVHTIDEVATCVGGFEGKVESGSDGAGELVAEVDSVGEVDGLWPSLKPRTSEKATVGVSSQ